MPERNDWIEGCLVLTNEQWHVLLCALDRFACARTEPVNVKARAMAKAAFKQVRDYILSDTSPDR